MLRLNKDILKTFLGEYGRQRDFYEVPVTDFEPKVSNSRLPETKLFQALFSTTESLMSLIRYTNYGGILLLSRITLLIYFKNSLSTF